MTIPRMFGWKRVVASFAVATLAVIGLEISHNVWGTPRQTIRGTSQLPAVHQQASLEATDLQKVQQALGPFIPFVGSDSSTPNTKAPAVLLVKQDGSTAASQTWTVPAHAGSPWVQQSSPQIAALSVSGNYVTFTTSTNSIFAYTVTVGQPFVLEAEPGYVMYIDADRKQWILSTTFAIAKRQHL